MKNVKNRPKTRNPPKTKKIPWLNYDFLGIFKVKKTRNLNIQNHLTQKKRQFWWLDSSPTDTFSKPKSGDLLYLLQQQKMKNK